MSVVVKMHVKLYILVCIHYFVVHAVNMFVFIFIFRIYFI